MILDFKCSNYRSINKEVDFSLLATSDKAFEDKLILTEEERVLRCAQIYGSNGSGKTTLLSAIATLTDLVKSSNSNQPGDNFEDYYEPHKLNQDSPTKFSIWFMIDDCKIYYDLSYNLSSVVEENLYYIPNGRTTKVFERKGENFSFGPSFEKNSGDCSNQLRENKLLLSVAANITKIEIINKVFMFFKEDIIMFNDLPSMGRGTRIFFSNKNYSSAEAILSNSEMKAAILDFIKPVCKDLVDIEAKVEDVDLSRFPPEILEDMSEEQKKKFSKRTDVTFIYKDFSVELYEESSGVRKLFTFLTPIFEIINTGKVFMYDELERSLHPMIVQLILKLFMNNQKSNAQAIFTTHATELLDLDLVRRDQIWFTELNSTGRATDLYSLSEVKNVRNKENIRKGYIEGRYGAIPFISNHLISEEDDE